MSYKPGVESNALVLQKCGLGVKSGYRISAADLSSRG
jgi:hypothetical protein